MKTYFILCLYLCLPMLIQAQLKMTNNGAVVKVSTGTDLRVNNGSIDNKNAGQINNNGNIYLDVNFDQTTSATYTGGATSWLWFEGTANQNATGDAVLNIAKLRVDNGNRLLLGNSINVSDRVDLTNNGNIELGNFNLAIASGGTVTGYDASNYIITNGTGFLQQEVASADVFFPVGNSSYNPATLNNVGVVDNIQVRVFDQVFDQGTTGTAQTTNVVNRTWMVSEETLGGSDVTMTLQWATADELSFDRTNSGVAHHLSGTTWDYPSPYTTATAAGADWIQTRSGFTSFSPFIVLDAAIDLPIELLSFDAKRQDMDNVNLTWATATEINNSGFEVERMLENETTFKKIAWVDGAGTTTLQQNYELMDANSYPSISYYRLKQVDFDGTVSYSPIRAVEGVSSASDIVLMPNPTSDVINIRFGEFTATTVQIMIYAADGKLVLNRELPISSYQVLTLPETNDFAAGTYLLRAVLNDGTNFSSKFVKIRN